MKASYLAAHGTDDQIEFLKRSKYPLEAYDFAFEAFRFAANRHESQTDTGGEERPNSRSPEESLCRTFCDYAISKYGIRAQETLAGWSISKTDDFGCVMLALVEVGLVQFEGSGELGNFDGLFDLDAVFEESQTGN